MEIGELPSDWQFLSVVFTKYLSVFGVNVFASEDTPDSKIIHVSNVLAHYLDNNADGAPDNPLVLSTMTDVNASIFMVASEDDRDRLWDRLPERFHEMADSGELRVQDLDGEETNPDESENRFDASLEEVLHLITQVGYAEAYPNVFGEKAGSKIAGYMDVARGGHFEERRESDCDDDRPTSKWKQGQCALPPNGEYPNQAWYTYDDPTCDYRCMITEYFYWALTSILGAQKDYDRCTGIAVEWTLCNLEQVKIGDPNIYELLIDPTYMLPTILPDGTYPPIPR